MIAARTVPTLVAAVGFPFLAAVLLAMAVALCFKPRLWLPSLALFLGLLIGYVDLLSSAAQLPALMLLAAAFFVGFARPRHPWRWALLLGIWIPAGGVIQLALKTVGTPSPIHPAFSLLALIPALVGAYGGAFTAQVGARAQPSSTLAEPG